MRRLSLTRNQNRTGHWSARTARTIWRAVACIVFWLTANLALAADKAPVMVTPGAFSVSATGALTYSIPIAVPPGTAGMVPSLSLDYNSQSGNGLVGVGWTLSGLPAVARCARTVAQDGNYDPVNNPHPVSAHGGVDYDGNDVACLDGQRLKVINGRSYWSDGSEYRTEIDGFSRVIYHASGSYGSWFEVHTKSGQTMQFGNSASSQIMALCSSPSVTRLWAVNQISDAVQNYLTVIYGNDTACGGNGQYLPAEIDYTGNAAQNLTPYNKVTFQYAPRIDVTPRYEAGYSQSTTWRLNYIYTYASVSGTPTLTSQYALTYQGGTGPNDHSLLDTVQQCDGNGNCLPATTFHWLNGGGTPTQSSGTPVAAVGWGGSYVADWNGHGLNDTFDSNLPWQPGNGGPGTGEFNTATQNGDQTFSTSTQYLNLGGNCFCNADWYYEFSPGYRFALDLTGKGISNFAMGDTIDVFDQNGNEYNDDEAYLYQNDGTGTLSYWKFGFFNAWNPQVGDLDGDGRADFWLHYTVGNSPTSGANLSNGDGTFDAESIYTPTFIGGNVATYLADFDGDGCTDILTQSSSEHNIHFECSHAANTVSAPNWLGQGFQVIIGDFNGDGKADVLTVSASTNGALYLSTGKGFAEQSYSVPTSWGNTADYDLVAGDWNGDGKTDIALVSKVSGTPHEFWLSTGTGFTQVFTTPNTTSGNFGSVGDWNGDGIADIEIGNGTTDTIYYMGYAPEVMTEIDNGIGVQTYVSYNRINAGGSFYVKETSANYPTRDLDGPFYVVSEADSANGLGTCTGPGGAYCYTSTYAYSGAKVDLQGRGFLGFHTVSITDVQTGVVQTTTYHQDFPYTGLIASQTKSYGSMVLSSIANSYCYSSHAGSSCAVDDTGYPATTGANTYFVMLWNTIQSGADLDGTTLPTVTTNYGDSGSTGYDAYGDVLKLAVTTQLGSESSTKTTLNTYQAADTVSWILGRLTLANTTATFSVVAGSITRHNSFLYYSNGLLSEEVIEPGDGGTMRVATDYGYDPFGNKTQATASGLNVANRVTSTDYEAGKARFALSDYNALGQGESWSVDERFGLPTQQLGPNGILTEWSYDGFGRKTSETRFTGLSDSNNTQIAYNLCSPGGCPGGAAFYVTSTPMRAGTQNGPETITYYDMLSRVFIVDVQAFNNQSTVCWARTYTVYDGNGRVSKVSRPYFFNYPSGCPTDQVVWTTNTYDALGRAYSVSNPNGGTITTGFHGLSTTVTVTVDGNSADNQTTTTVKNVLGKTKSVTDTQNNTTTYNYDAYGDLLTVADPAGNVSRYSYDTRGRKLYACEPDKVADIQAVCDSTLSYFDEWAYAYDPFNELLTQKDSNGNVTTLVYDAVGHVIARSESGLYSTWAYGTSAANHNVGKLVQTKACTSSSACTGTDLRAERDYSYDDHGRQTSVALTVSGTGQSSFTTAYNADQGIASVTYPSGFVAQYSYTSLGFTTGLSDGSGNVLWQMLSRDSQHSSEQTQNPSNGSIAVATTRTFDPNTGLVTNITARGDPGAAPGLTWTQAASPCTANCWGSDNWGTGPAVLANLSYSYDLLGKMTERSDSASNNTQYFCYDSLNRITGYNSPDSSCTNGSLTVTMFYDALGNVTEKSDLCGSSNCYSYPSAGQPKPHAVSSVAGSENGVTNPTYTYDNNGNMLTGAGRTMVYTAFNMVARMTQGTSNLCWGYDADHQRARMDVAPDCSGSSPASTTYYLHDALSGLMEDRVVSGGNTSFTDYLIVGGAIIGTHTQVNSNTPTTTFYVLDSQGSVAVTTDQTGALLCRITYTAFGLSTASGSSCATPSREYLSQETINDGALYNLINLNARVFDPVLVRFMGADPVVNPYEPQDLNPYSYGLNSPLWLPDPSGMCFLGCFWNQSWFRPLVSITVAVVGAYFMPAFLANEFGGIFATEAAAGSGAAAVAPSAVAYAASGAIVGGASGAVATGTLKGALIGAFEGAAFAEVGNLIPNPASAAEIAESAALHGLVGGLASAAGGGNFGSGFIAAGLSGLASPAELEAGPLGGTAIASIVGGAGSVLGGGKFANGAETGAFGYLLNALPHMWAGTEATYALQARLNLNQPNSWLVNRSLWGLINGFADLIYVPSGETYELKTNLCLSTSSCLNAAQGQLAGYIASANQSGGNLQIGSVATMFGSSDHLTAIGTVMGTETWYSFNPGPKPGLVGYDILNEQSTWISDVIRNWNLRKAPPAILPFGALDPVVP